MYLFFRRFSKLSARRDNSRFFSSLPQSPYLLMYGNKLRESPEGEIVNHRLFDPAMYKTVCSIEKKVPKEIDGQLFVGASHGWAAVVGDEYHNIHLTDLYKPWVSSPRVIPLPSPGIIPSSTTSISAKAMSLSSSDPVQDKDLFVAAKFNDFQLSVCRPSDSKWTHIECSDSLLPNSTLTYSKRDKAFYFTSSKGLYLGLLDLSNNYELKYYQLRLQNLPKLPNGGWKRLAKCKLSMHLVESPSGELFFIMWYTKYIREDEKCGEFKLRRITPKRFLVFREDEKTRDFCYTEDIGDLCIFLGKSEAFCVSASMYPGLLPNSIYYNNGPGVGSYDLASGKGLSHWLPRAALWLLLAFTPLIPLLNNGPFWILSISYLSSSQDFGILGFFSLISGRIATESALCCCVLSRHHHASLTR